MGTFKVCNKCNKELPATIEYFDKNKARKDGLSGRCRTCRREYYRQYVAENKEKVAEYQKSYAEENKEHLQKYAAEYYQENQEHLMEVSTLWYAENKELVKERRNEYSREFYKKNKESENKRTQQWRKENRDKDRVITQRRRAKKRKLPATLTSEQWGEILSDFNNSCAYCGKSEEENLKTYGTTLHQEHFIPLSKGGEYTTNNIIVACGYCNNSKFNKDFFRWYPTYEHYDRGREQFILEYLGYSNKMQQLSIL